LFANSFLLESFRKEGDMGQKLSPKINRLGYIEDWTSKWFNLREMPDLVEEDFSIRKYIDEKLKFAAISKVVIERTGKFLRLSIYTGRPGIVIGRGGQEIENLKQDIEEITGKKVFINVMEIKVPALDAQLVSYGIALQLEKNINYRRAVKRAMERTMASGALGIKVMVSGRLGGAEIARSEWLKEGRIPLHTFRADINYGFSEAMIKKGKIGVKTWIFRREFFRKTDKDLLKEAELVGKETGVVDKKSPEDTGKDKSAADPDKGSAKGVAGAADTGKDKSAEATGNVKSAEVPGKDKSAEATENVKSAEVVDKGSAESTGNAEGAAVTEDAEGTAEAGNTDSTQDKNKDSQKDSEEKQ
jgi:small subunit ribosomal protein S3